MAYSSQPKSRTFLRAIYDALGFDAVEKRYHFNESVKRVLRYYYRLVWQEQARYHRGRGVSNWFFAKAPTRVVAHGNPVSQDISQDVLLRWLERFTLVLKPVVHYAYRDVYALTPLPQLTYLPHAETVWHKLHMLQLQQLLQDGWHLDNQLTHQNAFQRCLDTLATWQRTGQITPEVYKEYAACVHAEQTKYNNYYTSKAEYNKLWRGLDGVSLADKWSQYLSRQREHAPQPMPGKMSPAMKDEIYVSAQLRAVRQMPIDQVTAPAVSPLAPVSAATLNRPQVMPATPVSGKQNVQHASQPPMPWSAKGASLSLFAARPSPRPCSSGRLMSAMPGQGARH